jgi:hypothetical protein
LGQVIADLQERQQAHDQSKLAEPELAIFNEFTPRLQAQTYGSQEYRESLDGMGDGLAHHYRENRHHPEHFADGFDGMNLVDVIEMLADWKAATLRHADGDLERSIAQNAERFGYRKQVHRLLLNTARDLGWL